MNKLAVFASGTGSNFEAIMQAIKANNWPIEVALVVVDNKTAPVIEKAKHNHIPVFCFDSKSYTSKQAYEIEIIEKCQQAQVDLLVLAGYMRILSKTLIDTYPNKIINIHPSLLPAFVGKDAIEQAIAYGVKVMGISIHYVDYGMDSGQIIAQSAFQTEGLSHCEIERKIHCLEHQLYPEVIYKILEGNL